MSQLNRITVTLLRQSFCCSWNSVNIICPSNWVPGVVFFANQIDKWVNWTGLPIPGESFCHILVVSWSWVEGRPKKIQCNVGYLEEQGKAIVSNLLNSSTFEILSFWNKSIFPVHISDGIRRNGNCQIRFQFSRETRVLLSLNCLHLRPATEVYIYYETTFIMRRPFSFLMRQNNCKWHFLCFLKHNV